MGTTELRCRGTTSCAGAAEPHRSMRVHRPIRHLVSVAAAAFVACHDSTGPRGGALLRFSGAAGATDTVDAIIPQALTVEVHDSSGALPPAGTIVRFTASPAPVYLGTDFAYGAYRGTEVTVGTSPTAATGSFVAGTTDQAGRVAVFVRLGITAGVGRLAVNVPTLGLEDTVRFTVKPGNAVQLTAVPADTALYVGKSYTVSGGAVDRYDNPRPDPVAWSTTAQGITVTNAGVVTTTAEGRYPLQVVAVPALASGGRTVWVRVVPRVRFVVAASVAAGRQLLAIDADGSNQTIIATVADGGVPLDPSWIPGTSSVVYTAPANGRQALFAVGSDGVQKPFLSTSPATPANLTDPTPTADGKWLFFSASDTQCPQDPQYGYCIGRSRIDGSGYELLQAGASTQPAPSPDGTKVAFYSPVWQEIRVFDIATNTVSSWSVRGSHPVWSPDGTRIAYQSIFTGLYLVNADGTGDRMVASAETSNVYGWSPDGRWVLVQQTGGPTLIDATTDVEIPLGYYYNKSGIPWSMK